MKALVFVYFIAIFIIIEWQERKELRKSFKKKPPDPQLSLFDDDIPMYKDQIHPLCEN